MQGVHMAIKRAVLLIDGAGERRSLDVLRRVVDQHRSPIESLSSSRIPHPTRLDAATGQTAQCIRSLHRSTSSYQADSSWTGAALWAKTLLFVGPLCAKYVTPHNFFWVPFVDVPTALPQAALPSNPARLLGSVLVFWPMSKYHGHASSNSTNRTPCHE
jgi:hypothetical protein